MKRIIKTFLFLVAIGGRQQVALAQSNQAPFVIGSENFLLQGRPFVIRCGEMHFARIPRDYWRQRLKMAKAMGLNTICAYLFWNFHEQAPGKFNWSGQADAAAFCRMAQEEGLYVLLRPGPYSCAEWDFGGLPWWLLQKKDIHIRSRDPYFLQRSRLYLREVGRVLAPLQISRGGNILMVQVENEYGSYGNDTAYIGQLRDDLRQAGFTVPFFTCDGPSLLKNDVRDDVFSAVNFGSDPEGAFKALRAVRPAGPLMVSEYYPGWFDSWGGTHMTGPADKVVKDIAYMLDHQASFSIYMVHGGTTFGLWAGANADPYMPETSSYDYDAPISENGMATAKYYQLRTLLSRYLQPGETLPDVPASLPVQVIPPFSCTEVAPVMDQLTRSLPSDSLLNMEDKAIGQGYGDLLYETNLPAGDSAILDVTEVHDYALVYLNDSLIGKLDRRKDQHLICLPPRTKPVSRLRMFVEAMGRVNWGHKMQDRKGLSGAATITTHGVPAMLSGWNIYPFPLGEKPPSLRYKPVVGLERSAAASERSAAAAQPLPVIDGQPALYKASFTTYSKADIFLDMHSFNKGVVWVNGHNLGRYWNIGPTHTMYLPGVWLKKGRNEVVVMDLCKPASLELQGLEKPVL